MIAAPIRSGSARPVGRAIFDHLRLLAGAPGKFMDTLIDTSNHLWMRWRVAEGLCCLAAVLLLFCTPAHTLDDTDAIPGALDRTYKEWMSKNDLTTGSLATMKNGVVVKSFDYGNLKASQPAQIASLSKAVTAVC